MDPNLKIPWSRRIYTLRQSTHYTPRGLSILLNIGLQTLHAVESGQFQPTLELMRRVRLLERIFHDSILQYAKDKKRWGERSLLWEKRTKQYDDFNGLQYRTKTQYFGAPIIPERETDIEALGGMDLIRRAAGKKYRTGITGLRFGRKNARQYSNATVEPGCKLVENNPQRSRQSDDGRTGENGTDPLGGGRADTHERGESTDTHERRQATEDRLADYQPYFGGGI